MNDEEARKKADKKFHKEVAYINAIYGKAAVTERWRRGDYCEPRYELEDNEDED